MNSAGFYHLKQGADDEDGGGDEDEEEDEEECRMENIQPVLAVDFFLSPMPFWLSTFRMIFGPH